MAFPTTPADGQIATLNGIRYVYQSSTNSWTRQAAANATFSVVTDTFTGNGLTTSFSLSVTPVSKDFVSINIDGVSQLKTAYNIANNILTFTGTPINGAQIDVKTWNSTNVGVLTGLVYDSFTGDGTTVDFTLNAIPTSKNFTQVVIGGISQNKSTYSVSGSTLTFSTPPPSTAPIEVTTFGPAVTTAIAGGLTGQVQFNNGTALAGSSGLTFNNATNVLTIGGVAAATTGKAIAMSIVFGG